MRELEHVIEQAMVTTPGPVIEPENLPPQIVARHDEPFTLDFDHRRPLPEITAEFTRRIECAYLQRVLEKYRGRIELCAKHCGSRGAASARSSADTRSISAPTSRTHPGASNSRWLWNDRSHRLRAFHASESSREHRFLFAKLPGYEAYCRKVCSRLIPMVW